jgi:hypothetical protein
MVESLKIGFPMSTRNKPKLSQKLREIDDLSSQRLSESGMPRFMSVQSPNWVKYTLLAGFLFIFGLWMFQPSANQSANGSQNVVEDVTRWANTPDQDLLNAMGSWMQEMGYGELSNEELVDLRQNGVTATFTSKIRELGYTDITLDELVSLRQHDVSATFASMMHELGYTDLTLDDLKRLRDNGVTAYYTSNVHDLGYKNITIDQLISLKNARMSLTDIKRAQSQMGDDVSVEELVRYGISNQ